MAIILDGTTGITAPAIEDLDTPIATPIGGTGLVSPGSSTNVLTSDGTEWYSGAAGGGGGGGITAATAQSVSTLTNVTFTGIPSTAKRITVIFDNVVAGSFYPITIQVGTSGGYVTSGYTSATTIIDGISVYNDSASSGFAIYNSGGSYNINANFVLTNISGNKWVLSGCGSVYATYTLLSGGGVDAGAVVDSVKVLVTTGNFTSGTVNIFYE